MRCWFWTGPVSMVPRRWRCRSTSPSCRCRLTVQSCAREGTRSGNPIERIWLYLREYFLKLARFKGLSPIVEACCNAWNRLIAKRDRIRSLRDHT
jgi:hypothetical protein